MTILFVCYANLNRSPRAEMVCKRLLAERGASGINVVSAGTDANCTMTRWLESDDDYLVTFGVPKPKQLTRELIDSADVVVVLDAGVGIDVLNAFPGLLIERIVDIGIPDKYSVAHGNIDELHRLLEEKLPPLIDRWIEEAKIEPQ